MEYAISGAGVVMSMAAVWSVNTYGRATLGSAALARTPERARQNRLATTGTRHDCRGLGRTVLSIANSFSHCMRFTTLRDLEEPLTSELGRQGIRAFADATVSAR